MLIRICDKECFCVLGCWVDGQIEKFRWEITSRWSVHQSSAPGTDDWWTDHWLVISCLYFSICPPTQLPNTQKHKQRYDCCKLKDLGTSQEAVDQHLKESQNRNPRPNDWNTVWCDNISCKQGQLLKVPEQRLFHWKQQRDQISDKQEKINTCYFQKPPDEKQ